MYALKILLRFLVDEVGPDDGVALGDMGEWYRSTGREPEVVRGAHGKVCKELEITCRKGSQLKVANNDSMCGLLLQWFEIHCLEGL